MERTELALIRALLARASEHVRADGTLEIFEKALACAVLDAVREGYDPLKMLGLPRKSGNAPKHELRDLSITSRFLAMAAGEPDKLAKEHYGALADEMGFAKKNGAERVRKIVGKNRGRVIAAQESPSGLIVTTHVWRDLIKALAKRMATVPPGDKGRR